ncbi:methyl-accepting chemotaxis protein [Cellvibrio sp. ARAG 10.3]|uniref:methyl-accepting chemotaxis protein n=1 Tax=Cellvibrio sp. ARAG 10.3 TaxID=3451358 RepID=UPI003F47643A
MQQHVAATSARSEQISFWSTLVVILVALLVMAIIWYTLRVSFLQPMNSIMAHLQCLAKRTQESTAEIQQIIQAVQNGAAQAMQAMKQSQEKTRTTTIFASRAGQSITDITAAVGRIHDMNTQIATAAEEQSCAAEEINKNVIRVVGLVQSTNKSAQHSTYIATNLDNAARQLSVQIANFQV